MMQQICGFVYCDVADGNDAAAKHGMERNMAKQTTTKNAPRGNVTPLNDPANNLPIVGDNTVWAKPVFDVERKRVTVNYAVSPNADAAKKGDRFVVTTVYDFGDCEMSDILALAIRPVVIDTQRRFRTMYAENAAAALSRATWNQFNVKSDFIDAERIGASPVARARGAITKMSADERRALIEQINELDRAERATAKKAS